MASHLGNPFEHGAALQREFEGASDRAAAIVAGSFLDEVLEELLRTFLVENRAGDKKLFEGSGPLSTFSAKIEMAFRLGLVSEREHRTLHTIRSIRNEFAHELGDLGFTTQSIEARCRNIEVPIHLVTPRDIPLSQSGEVPPLPNIVKASSDRPRLIFQEAVMTLMYALSARVADAGRVRRKTPPEFASAHEPAERVLERLRDLLRIYKALLEEARAANLEAPDKAVDIAKYEHLVEVQEFVVQQLRAAHEHRMRGD